MANKNLIGKTLKKGDFVGKVTHITDSQITMINEYGYEKTFDIKKKVVKDNKSVKDVDIKLIPYLLLELDNNEELVEDATITDMPQPTAAYSGDVPTELPDPRNGKKSKIYPDYDYWYYIRPNDNKEIIIPKEEMIDENGNPSMRKAIAEKIMNKMAEKEIEEGLYTKEEWKNAKIANQLPKGHFTYHEYDYAKENYRCFIILEPGRELNPSKDKYAAFALTAFDENRPLTSYYLSTLQAAGRINNLGLYNTFQEAQKAVNRYFELRYDYVTFTSEYRSNIMDYNDALNQNKSIRANKGKESRAKTQETTIRKNTNTVSKTVGFNSDGIFVIGVKNPNLSIGDKSDYLHIGRVNNNIYTVVYHEYGTDANFQEVCTQFKPDRETINKLNSCQNILQAYSIIKEYWDAKALEYNLDISELYCRIDGPSIIQLLKDLGYQESGSSMFNPNVYPHYVPKSFTFRLGEGPQRELINYFS